MNAILYNTQPVYIDLQGRWFGPLINGPLHDNMVKTDNPNLDSTYWMYLSTKYCREFKQRDYQEPLPTDGLDGSEPLILYDQVSGERASIHAKLTVEKVLYPNRANNKWHSVYVFIANKQ